MQTMKRTRLEQIRPGLGHRKNREVEGCTVQLAHTTSRPARKCEANLASRGLVLGPARDRARRRSANIFSLCTGDVVTILTRALEAGPWKKCASNLPGSTRTGELLRNVSCGNILRRLFRLGRRRSIR